MSHQPSETLYELEKARATVRAYVADFRGKRYAHIRELVEPPAAAVAIAPKKAARRRAA